MNTKLTLSIDNEVIKRAKHYAKKSGRSLSDIIENYLKRITLKEKYEVSISPKVNNLLGSIKVKDDFDYKNELSDALQEKYNK